MVRVRWWWGVGVGDWGCGEVGGGGAGWWVRGVARVWEGEGGRGAAWGVKEVSLIGCG